MAAYGNLAHFEGKSHTTPGGTKDSIWTSFTDVKWMHSCLSDGRPQHYLYVPIWCPKDIQPKWKWDVKRVFVLIINVCNFLIRFLFSFHCWVASGSTIAVVSSKTLSRGVPNGSRCSRPLKRKGFRDANISLRSMCMWLVLMFSVRSLLYAFNESD